MNILFATGSSAGYMLPPSLGDDQVCCGPDWSDSNVLSPDERRASLNTPLGEYDLAAVAARLPAAQKPDLVACLVDASRRNLPRNLKAFDCPRLLLVADTHHMGSPIIEMLRYATSEPFDRIVFLYDRHHAAFFHAAGLRNIYWFPGLTFPHSDAAVRAARQQKRAVRIAFVGQAGQFHPRRARLLEAISARSLPLELRQISQSEGLAFCGSSLVGFNASLNGDLNLRIFELLAAGTAVLTDRLAPESGLEEVFNDGEEILTYTSSEDLVDKAARLIAQPSEARALGAAAAHWFDENFNEAERREAFRKLAFDGIAAFPLPFDARTPVFFGGNTDLLLESIVVYETVQELHRTQERVCVTLDPTVPADFTRICATLPRVQVASSGEECGTQADLAVFGRENITPSTIGKAPRLWCWNAQRGDIPTLAKHFAAAGFSPAGNDLAFFCKTEASTLANHLKGARALFRRRDFGGALTLAQMALRQDPGDAEVFTLIGEIALEVHTPAPAENVFRKALQLRPGHSDTESGLADSLRMQGHTAEADALLTRVLQAHPGNLRALISLSRLRAAEGRFSEAEAALRHAAANHPGVAQAPIELGNLLKRRGRVIEAIAWHRRALGAGAEVPIIDPDSRPVRVVFLAQHPQGWTSMEAIWRAFAADPAFETQVMAAPYNHSFTPEGGREAIYDFLGREGIPYERWDRAPLEPNFADIVFVQNPYDGTRPGPLQVVNLIKLVPRLAYVPYGVEIGGGNANAENQFNLPLQQLAWAIFARSARHKAMFARHCTTGDTHVEVTGHPRLDTLRPLAQLPPDPEFTAFAGERRIVFWNPQFDVNAEGTGYSTFLIWQSFFLEEFARRRNLAFVIRPHPLFFSALESRGIWNAVRIEGFLERVRQAGNVLIDRRSSYLPIFAASAAMLSDASSFLLEYSATNKPLLYLHNARGPQLNDDGNFVCTYNYRAEHREDVIAFLDMIEAGEDPRADARRAAYPEVMYAPEAGVAETIKRVVLQRLSAEARQAAASREAAI